MVQKAKLYELADAMLARGEFPTNDRLIERMGGSKTHTTPMLDHWRRDRRCFRSLVELDLNDDMAKALAKVVRVMTKAVEGRVSAGREGRTKELTARIGQLDATNEALTSEVERLRGALGAEGVCRPRYQGAARTRGTYAATQRFFWDRVMQEVHDLLDRGRLPVKEIVARLDPDTLTLACLLKGRRLTAGRLARQMRVRIAENYYFFEPAGGVFQRVPRTKDAPKRPGWKELGLKKDEAAGGSAPRVGD